MSSDQIEAAVTRIKKALMASGDREIEALAVVPRRRRAVVLSES
jgi:transcriptional regulator NrdR family protein